jgi:uncharacterized protein
MTTIIHHSADFDGLFCREIARKFLPDAKVIGWDFLDAPLPDSLLKGKLMILDLPIDRPFGLSFNRGWICRGDEEIQPIDRWDSSNITWIDHHKSSIESHPADIAGYRIDGVAACRLAWQWFSGKRLLDKQEFIDRKVSEPWAVRLAGEYDIWDKRDPDAELFQHGLRSRKLGENMWDLLLTKPVAEEGGKRGIGERVVQSLLDAGKSIQYAKTQENAAIIARQGFDLNFEGLRFLACNHAMYNSHLFAAGIEPEHDALLGFRYDGKKYHVSLYHKPGREDLDLSLIATKFGGGGHRGACGFSVGSLNEIISPQ